MSFAHFFNYLRQFWRLAEARLLFLSLLISVVAVTSVSFFTDRADRAMAAQATQLLGGDLVIVSTRPINPDYLSEADKQGLLQASTLSFPSMVSSGEKFQLTQVKAVSKNYPLQGKLEVSADINGTPQTFTINQLEHNDAIAETRLFAALEVKAGAQVQLGQSKITLAKMIRKIPDQASSTFQIAPILILPLAKLKQTGLLTPASRASYRYFFAGNETQISTYKKWLKPRLKPSEHLRTLDDGLPTVQNALQRGQRFLKMAALLAVILAGAGIALSSYSLTRRETTSVAVLKTLGASRKQILFRYLGQLFIVATLAGILGSLLGYFIHTLLAISLQEFVGQNLPEVSWQPVITGFITAWIMAIGFSAAQLLQLVNIAPIQILQVQNNRLTAPYLLSFVILSAAIFLLMWLQTQDLKLSIILLIAVISALAIFWLIAVIMLRMLGKLGQRWPLPKTHQRMTILVVVFAIGLFSLLLLTTLRGDLINRWQASIPVDAPNHFLINIQPDEVKPLQAFLHKNLSIKNDQTPLYPMLLGRLVAINNKTVSPDDYQQQRAQRLLIREFNLSATTTMPEGNIIRDGKWFKKEAQKGLSVEQGIAKTLKLKMGDSLTFDIAGQRITEKIISLRSVKWDSMKPNFFVLLAPQAIKNYPKTYITSLHITDNAITKLPGLIRQFPTVTDIDVSAILAQVRDLIDKAAFAVQAIFLFTLVAGVVVLFAALQSQKAMRRKEIAILKTLGASRTYLRRSLLLEFSLIGGLAGFLASILALTAGNIAAFLLFDLNPEINLSLIATGTTIGAVLVGVAGYFNVRGLLSVMPVSLFR
jgi:putative ABC transport system permease protein